MNQQRATSACTSINKNRLPAIYGKLLVNNERVVDYGCGRYTDHIYDACKAVHAAYFPFDPYNQPRWKNQLTRTQLAERPATMGVMSNVLNVIDSDDAIAAAVNDACSLIADTCFLHITVYEGDRTGIGRYTGPDSYQRNLKTRDFATLLRTLGFNASIYHGMIMIPGKNPHCFHSTRK